MSHRKLKDEPKQMNEGHFFCPKCNNVRPYQRRQASIDFSFYFISIFETGDLKEFVVCLLCKKGFHPEVLQPHNQTIFRLSRVARQGLLKYGPDELKKKLLKEGIKEPVINGLIILAQNS